MVKRFIMFAVVLMLTVPNVQAADFAGTISYSSGDAWVLRGQEKHPAPVATKVLPGDVIITRNAGRVKLSMNDGSTVYLGEKSRLVVDNYNMHDKTLKKGVFNLLWGKVRLQVAKLKGANSSFSVKTKTATIGVRGTQFAVMYPKPDIPKNAELAPIKDIDIKPAPTTVMLFEGAVLAKSLKGVERSIKPGTLASIKKSGFISVRPILKNDVKRLDLEKITPPASAPLPKATAPKKPQKAIAKPTPAPKKKAAPKANVKNNQAPKAKALKIKKLEIEKPEIEAPETEAPENKALKVKKVKAPKAKKLKVEAPEIDEPKVKKLKAPKLEKVKIEAPEIDEPKVKKLKAPKLKKVKIEAPEIKAPEIDEPKVKRLKAPKVKKVKIEAPKVKKVKIEAPKVKKVKIEAPKVKKVKIEAPKVKKI
ncbi:MAG: FecR family protein, partial [Mariprofundaceae bacterium]